MTNEHYYPHMRGFAYLLFFLCHSLEFGSYVLCSFRRIAFFYYLYIFCLQFSISFHREIIFLQGFGNHENIIKLTDVMKAENDKDIYLVFEYMGKLS